MKQIWILGRVGALVMAGREEDRRSCARIVVEVTCGGPGLVRIAAMVEAATVRGGAPDLYGFLHRHCYVARATVPACGASPSLQAGVQAEIDQPRDVERIRGNEGNHHRP